MDENTAFNELSKLNNELINTKRELSRLVHEKTIALKELGETKAILQAALDQSPAGIAIATPPLSRMRYVNQVGHQIRGVSPEYFDIDGRPIRQGDDPFN